MKLLGLSVVLLLMMIFSGKLYDYAYSFFCSQIFFTANATLDVFIVKRYINLVFRTFCISKSRIISLIYDYLRSYTTKPEWQQS